MNIRSSYALLICAIAFCIQQVNAKVTEISSQPELNEHKSKGKAILLKVYTTWCGPCKMMAPLYEKVSEQAEHQDVIFLSYDGDKDKEFTKSLKVQAYPTTISYNPKGEVVELVRGSMGETEINLVAKQAKGAARILNQPPAPAAAHQTPTPTKQLPKALQEKPSAKQATMPQQLENGWITPEEKKNRHPERQSSNTKKRCGKRSCR